MKEKIKSNAPLLRITLLIFFVAFASCTKSKESKEDSIAGGQNHAAEPKKEIWTCAMHPQIKRDGPGQCPICGMNLIKVDQNSENENKESSKDKDSHPGEALPEGHSSFKLSSARQQMIGVKFGTVVKKPLFKSIQAAGRLAFDPELYAAQNEYIEARRQVENTRQSPLADVRQSAWNMLESAKLRLKILGLTDPQIAKLSTSSGSSSNLLISNQGEANWVYAEIFEMDLRYVKEGLSAEIRANFLEGKTLTGKVISVDRVINPTTRTAKARIELAKNSDLLRPESYVDVNILSPLGEQITVPFDAILDSGKQAWVFVADTEGNFEPRLVTVMLHVGDDVAIASGLKEGEKIVTSANFLIDSESRIKGAFASE